MLIRNDSGALQTTTARYGVCVMCVGGIFDGKREKLKSFTASSPSDGAVCTVCLQLDGCGATETIHHSRPHRFMDSIRCRPKLMSNRDGCRLFGQNHTQKSDEKCVFEIFIIRRKSIGEQPPSNRCEWERVRRDRDTMCVFRNWIYKQHQLTPTLNIFPFRILRMNIHSTHCSPQTESISCMTTHPQTNTIHTHKLQTHACTMHEPHTHATPYTVH